MTCAVSGRYQTKRHIRTMPEPNSVKKGRKRGRQDKMRSFIHVHAARQAAPAAELGVRHPGLDTRQQKRAMNRQGSRKPKRVQQSKSEVRCNASIGCNRMRQGQSNSRGCFVQCMLTFGSGPSLCTCCSYAVKIACGARTCKCIA